jgi:hypothetical protein
MGNWRPNNFGSFQHTVSSALESATGERHRGRIGVDASGQAIKKKGGAHGPTEGHYRDKDENPLDGLFQLTHKYECLIPYFE